MKKIYSVLSISLFFSVCVHAQPVISSLKIPAFNTKASVKLKSGIELDPGAEGANQVWDFTGYDSTGSTISVSTIVDPSLTPKASEFPGATYSELTAQGNYSYSKITTSESIMLGNTQNSVAGNVLIKYSDPAVVFKLPFAYQQTFSDNFAAKYTANGMTMNKSGNTIVTYTGYGTLKTVYGTYNNVVRLKLVRTDYDTILIAVSGGILLYLIQLLY